MVSESQIIFDFTDATDGDLFDAPTVWLRAIPNR